MIQEELRQSLLNDVAVLEQRGRKLRELGPGQLTWHPPGGGWSVADVLEHLLATDGEYAAPMQELIRTGAGRGRPDAARRAWRGCWAGRWLAASMSKTGRLPAPRRYQPTPTPRADVVDAWLAQLAGLKSMLESAGSVDWRALKLGSPAMRLMILNLGDCFLVGVRHTQRHFGQIDRVRNTPGFPAH